MPIKIDEKLKAEVRSWDWRGDPELFIEMVSILAPYVLTVRPDGENGGEIDLLRHEEGDYALQIYYDQDNLAVDAKAETYQGSPMKSWQKWLFRYYVQYTRAPMVSNMDHEKECLQFCSNIVRRPSRIQYLQRWWGMHLDLCFQHEDGSWHEFFRNDVPLYYSFKIRRAGSKYFKSPSLSGQQER